VQTLVQLLPSAEMGTAQQENTVQVNHDYQQILENLIENLQSSGQEYTPEQAEGWAWDYFFKKYPEYCKLPEDYG
jgi:hypothetical protein